MAENEQGTVTTPEQPKAEGRHMSAEAKAKQAASMKTRWEDPNYRANVAQGRVNAKAKKETVVSVTTNDAGAQA